MASLQPKKPVILSVNALIHSISAKISPIFSIFFSDFITKSKSVAQKSKNLVAKIFFVEISLSTKVTTFVFATMKMKNIATKGKIDASIKQK